MRPRVWSWWQRWWRSCWSWWVGMVGCCWVRWWRVWWVFWWCWRRSKMWAAVRLRPWYWPVLRLRMTVSVSKRRWTMWGGMWMWVGVAVAGMGGFWWWGGWPVKGWGSVFGDGAAAAAPLDRGGEGPDGEGEERGGEPGDDREVEQGGV